MADVWVRDASGTPQRQVDNATDTWLRSFDWSNDGGAPVTSQWTSTTSLANCSRCSSDSRSGRTMAW